MAADNVVANPGAGGSTFRAYAEASGVEHSGCVVEYVTTLSAGANVLQPVQLTTGLPVQPQTGSTWAVTQSGTWTVQQGGSNWSVNLAQVAGSAIAQGHGTAAAAIRVELPTDGTGLVNAAQSGTWTVQQGGSNWSINLAQVAGAGIAQGHGTAASAIRVELPTDGTGLVNAAQSGTWTVQQGTPPWTVQPQAIASGGATNNSYLAAASANQDSTNVKASAGTVYSLELFNTTNTIRYVKLYDKATAPTSADTPARRYLLPGGTNGGGLTISFPVGLAFANGIGFRITTGVADNDTGAVTANDVIVNLSYK
jgi:hypothetical protein